MSILDSPARSLLSRLQSRKRERGLHIFALRPVVIGVALETTGFRVIWPGGVTGLASCNPRNQHIARIGAGERFQMATHAGESRVGFMIEFRMGQPAQRDIRRGHLADHPRRIRPRRKICRAYCTSLRRIRWAPPGN